MPGRCFVGSRRGYPCVECGIPQQGKDFTHAAEANTRAFRRATPARNPAKEVGSTRWRIQTTRQATPMPGLHERWTMKRKEQYENGYPLMGVGFLSTSPLQLDSRRWSSQDCRGNDEVNCHITLFLSQFPRKREIEILRKTESLTPGILLNQKKTRNVLTKSWRLKEWKRNFAWNILGSVVWVNNQLRWWTVSTWGLKPYTLGGPLFGCLYKCVQPHDAPNEAGLT